CIACHGAYGEAKPALRDDAENLKSPVFYPAPMIIPLDNLRAKTTPKRLALFLANPHAFNPTGRMPNLLLKGPEALDLAHFLCLPGKDAPRPASAPPSTEQVSVVFRRVDNRPEEFAAFNHLSR